MEKEKSFAKTTRRATKPNEDSRDSLLARELPHSKDAEEGLLASMILDAEGSNVVNTCISAKLQPEYFFFPRHQKIFKAILEMNKVGVPCEEIALAEKLLQMGELENIGGISELNRISSRIETYAHFNLWLDIVREKFFMRSLIQACGKAMEGAYDSVGDFNEYLDSVEQGILRISQDRIQDTAKSINTAVDEGIVNIQKMIQGKGALTGVATGFTDLDNITRGLHKTEMIVIAARPGMGKTSIALNMAESAIFLPEPVKVLIFSLEMGANQLATRMICSRARIDQSKLRSGFLENNKKQDLVTAAGELKRGYLWIDDSSDMNILEMRAKARRLKQQHGIGLVIVDYLQLVKGTDSRVPREQQVAEISRGMKAMAKELDLPVIVLAQLNRETEKENRDPRPSDLRESGSIEQDADIILLLSWKKKSDRDEQLQNTQNLVKLTIAKHRNGPTAVVDLIFNKNYTRYENYLPTSQEND